MYRQKQKSPVERMIKIKNNRLKSKQMLSPDDSGYHLEYCSPEKLYIVKPERPLNYNLAQKEPEKLIDQFKDQKVEVIEVRKRQVSAQTGEREILEQSELEKRIYERNSLK